MQDRELIVAMHKDPAFSAAMWAFMVASLRERVEKVEAPQFTPADLREALNRVESSAKRQGREFGSLASGAAAWLREQLEASA